MSHTDLFVLGPWIVFAAGVATMIVLAVLRGHGEDRPCRKRRNRR